MHAERETASIVDRSTHLRIERVGSRPTAGFLAGLHGDEGSIIPALREVMRILGEHPDRPIGDHFHCLEAHPEALARGTRMADGVDLNRLFHASPSIDHPKGQALAELLHAHTDLHTLFTFHEDTEDDRFYFYYHPATKELGESDTNVHTLRDRLLAKVQDLGVGLYTDIDDPDFGNMIVNGYVERPADGELDSTIEMWAVNKTHVNHPSLTRAFAFEIPGKLPQEKKSELLAVVFTEFILPYLSSPDFKAEP
ncbi:MAG TPA: succinylglutamate desuccinylase/aspartoacylase family protein [Patescibacteria group bacterium]|nr:succinylglutamate desuccinylase/aspartoacylase family protein [Patescibacteria group bacterium]